MQTHKTPRFFIVTETKTGQSVLCFGMNTVKTLLRERNCRISNSNDKYDCCLNHVSDNQAVIVTNDDGQSFMIEECLD